MTDIDDSLPKGAVWERAKAEPNWLLYRLAKLPGKDKLSKVPTTDGADNADRAAAANKTFSEARTEADCFNALSGRSQGEDGWLGLGYFPRSGAAMRAYDLDDCIDANGSVSADVAEILALGETFAEVSISGRGIRLWAAPSGSEADDWGTERNGYGASGTNGKFFTFLGQALDGSPAEIGPAPKTLARILAQTGHTAGLTPPPDRAAWDGPLEDIDEAQTEARLQEILGEGGALARRWGGDSDGLEDQSRSGRDFAVIGALSRAGMSFSEIVHLLVHHYGQPSAAVEDWNDGNERQMRRAYARARKVTAEEEFEPVEISTPGSPEGGGKVDWIEEADLVLPDLNEFWRVDGVVPLQGVGVVYGSPGSGKSFICMDLALSIATGRPWAGKDLEPCEVVYVSSEGGKRAAVNRMVGWRQAHGVEDTSRLHCASANFNLVGGATSFLEALAERSVRPGLVVIDTLNQNYVGDENSSLEMSKFVGATKAIQRRLNCFVLVIHHSGKNKANGARGHSALLGAVDFEAEAVGHNADPRILTITKNREGPSGESFGFDLKTVVLGQNNKGRDVTTLVPTPSNAPLNDAIRTAALKGRSETQKQALALLERHESLRRDFSEVPGWTLDDWTEEVLRISTADNYDRKPARRNMKASLKNLGQGNAPAVTVLGDQTLTTTYPII